MKMLQRHKQTEKGGVLRASQGIIFSFISLLSYLMSREEEEAEQRSQAPAETRQ